MDLFIFDKSDYVNGTWQDAVLETGSSYSIGDFKHFKGEVTEALSKSLVIQPPQLSGSDYSGGICEQSNHRTFLKQFKDVDGVYDLYGGYGTYGIAIRLDTYTTNEEIKEVIDGLEGYALVSEDDYSELEHDYEQQYVNDFAVELTVELNEPDADINPMIPDLDIDFEKDIGELVENLIWDAIHNLDMDFEYETTSAYIEDPDHKIRKYLEDRILIDHYKKLPLLINRKWVCEQTEQLFKTKLSGGTSCQTKQ
jgi:hypothetical protein